MVLDELMYQVKRPWYWITWGIHISVALALFSGSLAGKFIPAFSDIAHNFGMNTTTLYMTAFELVYIVGIYFIVARFSVAFATFMASIIHTLPMLNVMDQTAMTKYIAVFYVLWLIVSFLNGMFGPYVLVGSLLFGQIFVLLTINFDFAHMGIINGLFILGTFVVAGAGYFFWRNRFISKANEKLNQLSTQLIGKEQQANILIQSISDGIIVVDTSSKIILVNNAAAEMTAWPQKEIMNFDARTVLRLVDDNKQGTIIPDLNHPFTQVLTQKQRFSQTLELLNRKDEKMFISLVISPVITPRDNKLIGAIAVFRDVSKEKSEEKRRAEFISTASHEMRTPVAAIEGYLALAMNEKVSKIDPKAREFLIKAHKSTQHLGQLFQDLLTSAKAEDGRLTSHPEVVEMGDFIRQLAEDLRFSAEKKGLQVEFLINSNSNQEGIVDASASGSQKTIQPLYYTYVDPDRIREVITNVFDNAVKYTAEGGVKLGLTGNDQVVQVRVADTGPGIPKDDLPHLFEKFYRVDNSATRSVGGTGLGLFICKKIVELYKGTIWAESEFGKGTTFYINMPRLNTTKAQELKNKTPQA